MMVEPGTRLNDRYRLTDRIATGGMGEVWRARDEILDRDVAVKILKREYADDAAFIERFRAEARHTAGLTHPGIAGVYDYGEADGTAYLVMELVRGEPLSAILTAEGRLPADRALDVVAQAARALEVAHEGGVVHRDIKPGNILVCPDGTVKITDFGIARAADAVPLTQTGMVMGTAHYISPEQANGGTVTYASDVYSLGVVAYECLAGRRPFDAETPVAIAMGHLYEDPLALPDDVPAAVSGLVARAMAKDPEARFPSAAAFAQAADAVRGEIDGAPAVATTAAGPSHTMVLPAVGDETMATGAVGRPGADAATRAVPVTSEPATATRARSARGPVLIAVALLAVLLLGALAWGALRPAPERAVPTVRGLTRQAAEATLAERGLDAEVKTTHHDTVRSGVVIRQDPAPGAMLREGDDVSITISKGPQPVTLPGGLTGRPVGEVTDRLKGLGLTVTQQGRTSDQPFGTVISVAPTTGLHRGDTVTVTVSLGQPREDKGRGDGGKDDEKKDEGKGDD